MPAHHEMRSHVESNLTHPIASNAGMPLLDETPDEVALGALRIFGARIVPPKFFRIRDHEISNCVPMRTKLFVCVCWQNIFFYFSREMTIETSRYKIHCDFH